MVHLVRWSAGSAVQEVLPRDAADSASKVQCFSQSSLFSPILDQNQQRTASRWLPDNCRYGERTHDHVWWQCVDHLLHCGLIHYRNGPVRLIVSALSRQLQPATTAQVGGDAMTSWLKPTERKLCCRRHRLETGSQGESNSVCLLGTTLSWSPVRTEVRTARWRS